MRVFGETQPGKSICPGEAACQKWAGAAGKNHAVKERNACHPCDMFQTKTNEGQRNHLALERLAKSAMEIRTERQTGFPRRPEMVTNTTVAALGIVEQLVEQEERARAERQTEVILASLGIKPN